VTKIPPVDLSRQYKLIREEANLAVLEILNSGNYVGGQVVATFEQELANYLNVTECVSCNSGTDALFLALKAFNIGEGDEVITTPFSFFATAEVITRVGAKPVFVDIDLDTFNLNLAQITQAITSQTKAIIPVHLFGQPVDMTELMAIAKSHNLYVIEDCAQAAGASWNERKVGSIGHVGCFSFFPTKNLGACGDGGAITTNDQAIAKQMRILKEHGSPVRYRHDFIGINSRIDAIQAVILTIKLRHLDFWNQQRQKAANYYQELMQSVSTLKLPQPLAGGESIWNQYTICITDNDLNAANTAQTLKTRRDLIQEYLQQQNIISMIYYPIPLHLQPVYQNLGYQKGQLPLVEQAAREVLSLPIFPGISEVEQEQVVDALKDSLAKVSSF
jgi:dTDP-4-amino-4,6-dideoxygalactose transaminase